MVIGSCYIYGWSGMETLSLGVSLSTLSGERQIGYLNGWYGMDFFTNGAILNILNENDIWIDHWAKSKEWDLFLPERHMSNRDLGVSLDKINGRGSFDVTQI